ncbi:type IV pilus assembly protein PilM [Luteolibacter ambystomatis]|uniref:Type IV pilus assembly protein PilM n=1 Tax=Luteolibacter ambystomatis TaxID=2824561 RepID=A0A975G7B8_9BACT|nr:type IV pilus assembly protein PilM [Luteolibacter ambystomatis]QUE49630.1 type IV pilus assembly protein PilM [Luteolibacter ambystomatis]
MADNQTTVALNIGSQRISAAVFEPSKNGGLILKNYDAETIVADPGSEAIRMSQTRTAIASLVQRLKLGKSKVRYAISGQSVFTRFVKLPPLQEDNIEQLVTFEAQQHVPFPINEVVWDYELLESAGEKEVVIVAIKGEALDEINRVVTETGLSTAEVDVAPMALYNSFRASYGDLGEPVLLIDIGAKTSNLLYIEGGRFFTRSIAIGGVAITSAIAKEYGVSFVEAENQKISNGLVALGGGHTEQLDESVAALAMAIRNALTRLPAEIARTTNYYRSQHGGNAPRRVYLAGGGASLPYTREFFEEKLHLPVEIFNPMATVAVSKNVDTERLQREAHLMGELVGLGLRGIGKAKINIDLVPSAVEQSRAAERRKPFLITAAAIVLAGAGAYAGFQAMAAGKAEEKAKDMHETKVGLAPVQKEIEGLLKKEAELRKVADGYTSAESDRAFWHDALGELRNAFASDAVWVTELAPLRGYSPFPPKDPAAAKTAAGVEVVKPDFAAVAYGLSALADIRIEEVAPAAKGGKKTAGPAAAPAAPAANAIRIRGLWRKNDKDQNIVSALLKNLRDNSAHFKFKAVDATGKEVDLRDENILKVTAIPEKDELALPFELYLLLSREVAIK